jgi:hypothetical protein
MGTHLQALEILVEKGAGLAHVGHPAAVTQATITAELPGRLDTAWSQGTGPVMGR